MNWYNLNTHQYSAWQPGDIAVFDAATAALGVNVSGTVQTEGMTFQGNYATSIAPTSGGGQISTYLSNTIVVTGSQPAGPAAAAVVSTPITNTSSAGFQKTGNGTVTLAAGVGSLTFNSLAVSAGTLSIASAATVSGSTAEIDGTLSLSANGGGLTVSNSAVLQGSGTIYLPYLTSNGQRVSALTYASTATTSEFDGLLTGAGSLTVTSGILTIGGPANDYSGGTTVSGGTLRLKKGPGARPATLGSGTLDLKPGAVFDLNGCPFVLGSITDSPTGGDTITDSSESGGVTVLTTGSVPNEDFYGSITDSYDRNSNPYAASIRLVKTGAGTLTLHGASSFSGGAEIDGSGVVKLENPAALGSTLGRPNGLEMNAGTLDLNGNNLLVSGLDGAGGLITDTYNQCSGTTTITLYPGITTIQKGWLQIGDGSSSSREMASLGFCEPRAKCWTTIPRHAKLGASARGGRFLDAGGGHLAVAT